VFRKTILTGSDWSIYRSVNMSTNRSIPHISLHHVTWFEPITAAHFDQRYNKCLCWSYNCWCGAVLHNFFSYFIQLLICWHWWLWSVFQLAL